MRTVEDMREGSKNLKKVVTSFMDGPLIVTISTKAIERSQGAATNLVTNLVG